MRLRTIGVISTFVLGLLAGPLPTEAQQTGKVYRIGYLSHGRKSWGSKTEQTQAQSGSKPEVANLAAKRYGKKGDN